MWSYAYRTKREAQREATKMNADCRRDRVPTRWGPARLEPKISRDASYLRRGRRWKVVCLNPEVASKPSPGPRIPGLNAPRA